MTEAKKEIKKAVEKVVKVQMLKEQLEANIKIYNKRIGNAKAQLDMVPQITATLNQSLGARLQCEETLKRLEKDGK